MSINNTNITLNDFEEPIANGFLKSVIKHPDKNALFIKNYVYSYQKLFEMVVAIYKNIPSNKTYNQIGIYCNDDIHTYASILAVSLYGAAYVPINNKYPAARNINCIEQCGLSLILSSNEDAKEVAGSCDLILTNVINSTVDKNTNQLVLQKVKQETAYILFTSGSTGEPKGVPVSNLNVNHFFNFFILNYNFNTEDKFLQVYELTFDVSVFSFFIPLLVGACCYVVPTDGIKFTTILKMLKDHKITVVSMVPTILNYVEPYLNEISLPALRYSFFSGDTLYHRLAEKWSKTIPNAQLHNFYGPTETTIVCTRYCWNISDANNSENNSVPLGKPFEGMEFLIVDEHNKTADKGELCFTGTQVISNYLNNINNDRFINFNSKRYYKTGDIASINDDGNLIFHGRMDSQVKINGYRMELMEIEQALNIVTSKKCIVGCKLDDKKMNFLVAFIETNRVDENNIIRRLKKLVPDYMIPKKIMAVEIFPLNINGKVDKNKLLNEIETIKYD